MTRQAIYIHILIKIYKYRWGQVGIPQAENEYPGGKAATAKGNECSHFVNVDGRNESGTIDAKAATARRASRNQAVVEHVRT
jgi:hypothetical protein